MKKNSDYFRRIHAVLFEKTAQGSILKYVDRLLSKRATHCKVLWVYFSSSLQMCILYANERLTKAAAPECNGNPLLMMAMRHF